MNWIVIWFAVSCVPCDGYFTSKGKEPCYEPKRTEYFKIFSDQMEAASFASVKVADGYTAHSYLLDSGGTLDILRKRMVINALTDIKNIEDEKAERAGLDPIDLATVDALVDDLISGELELYAPVKKSEGR